MSAPFDDDVADLDEADSPLARVMQRELDAEDADDADPDEGRDVDDDDDPRDFDDDDDDFTEDDLADEEA